MQVLRLLAAARRTRRAVSTITAVLPAAEDGDVRDSEDEGPFFDLDFSVRASSSSGSESDDSCTELDFVISLQRSRSASPSYESLFFGGAAPVKFCSSEPSKTTSQSHCCTRNKLRALSFASRKVALYGGRDSFSRSSNSARSLRLFMASPVDDEEQTEPKRAPSGDVIRRYLRKISRRLRRVGPRAAAEARGGFRLRKSRSASSAAALEVTEQPPPRRDDSLLEKQDGIASAIAHCKESLHRASVSECDLSLLRSRSDPGKHEAAA